MTSPPHDRTRQPQLIATAFSATTQAAVALIAMACALLLIAPAAAVAQPATAGPSMDLSLVAIDPVVDSSGSLSMTVDLSSGRAARSDLRLVATVFGRVSSTQALRAALDGNPRNAFSSVAVQLGDLGEGLSSRVQLTASSQELGLDDEGLEGVYPLELQVFEGADAVGQLLTAVVVAPSQTRAALPVTIIKDLYTTSEPIRDDIADTAFLQQLSADGPLILIARELEAIASAGSAAGLVLAVDGRLIEDLDAVADGVTPEDGPIVDLTSQVARRAARVRAAITTAARRGDVQVLALPYGPGDLTALARGGLEEQAIHLVERGRETVAARLGVVPAEGVVAAPLGVAVPTLEALGPLPTDLYVLPPDNLRVPVADAGRQPVRRLPTQGGGELRVLHADAELAELLVDPDGRGNAAVIQDLLARTALRWMSDGARIDPAAGVVIDLGVDEVLPAGMLTDVLRTLRDASWLRPVNATRLAELVRASAQPAALAYGSDRRNAELAPAYIDELQRALQAMGPLEAMLPASGPTTTQLLDALDLAAVREGASTPGPAGQNPVGGQARIDEILALSTDLVRQIDVFEGPPLTLTSTTGEVPVLIRSQADVQVRVTVRVLSTRFDVDDPVRDVLLEPQSARTLTFSVKALNPGALAGVNVVVQDPTGTIRLEQTRIAVRSTAFPVVALAATLGGSLLLLWWGVKQNRRRKGGAIAARENDAQAA